MKPIFALLPVAAIALCACGGSETESLDDPTPDASSPGSDAGSDANEASTQPEGGQDGTTPDAPQPGDAALDTTEQDAGPLDSGVDPTELQQEDEGYCGRSQREVENFTTSSLPDSLIEIQTQTAVGDFEWSKPEISGGKVVVQSFRPNELERGSVYEQAWCKLKTQAAVEDGLSIPSEGPSLACKVMNEAAIAWALDHVSPQVKAAWDARALVVEYADDEVFGQGNQWVPAKMVVERKDEETIRLQSMALLVEMDIPVVGRMHYCKVLSPAGAVALVTDVANAVGIGSDGSEFPIGTDGYTIDPTGSTLYDKGFVAHIKADGDDVDVYVPVTPQVTQLPAAIYMQGGKVDKVHYRSFSRLLAAHGFVVAVANHDSMSGANMTEQSVFNEVWAQLEASGQDAGSPLHGRVDPTQVAVMGHSLGGVAALAILANTCSPPTCFLGYDAPPELSAGVLYGTNSKTPMIGTWTDYDLRNIPTLFVQGSVDGKALLDDGLATFHDHVTGVPRGFVTVEGANHYGITDVNNPPGADADPNAPVLDQQVANETVARWTAMFLRAHMHGDTDAQDYVYAGTGDTQDTNAEVEVIE